MSEETIQGYVPNRHQLFGRTDMRRLIDPASIAVIGASESPASFGFKTLENIDIGYGGRVYPINPKDQTIRGLPCYPSLEALPEVPDCVVVIVPMEQVEPLVIQAAALGVGGMVIYSAGFAEVGEPALVAIQQRIAKIAAQSGMRVFGPNCVGIINFTSKLGLTFMPKFNEMPIHPGTIGLVSQSGALGYCVLQAAERGIGFTHYLAPGNSCDVDVCDMINYLVEDDRTKVIACLFEGVRDGARLLEAAQRALAAGKPLLIYKLANTEIAQRTALSHTGTLAGSNAAYMAAFRKAGVVVIDNWEELLETALLFARASKPVTDGIGIMASSGGAAIMAADKAAEFGVLLPPPEKATSEKLAAVIPHFGSTANPCDLTAESLRNAQMYGSCIKAFADDPNFAAIVVPMMSANKPATVERAQYLSDLASTLDKPVCLVWVNEWHQGPGSEVYDASEKIVMFRSMMRCIKALKSWIAYYGNRDCLLARIQSKPAVAATSQAAVPSAIESTSGTLSESASKNILAGIGVPVTREALVQTAEQAVTAAQSLGYPVALKVDSSTLPHKTEAGVIRLGLTDEAALRKAFGELLHVVSQLSAKSGQPVAINGFLVQEMVTDGVEMMIGFKRDVQFGPLVMCGFGGIDLELTRDVAVALAPVTHDEATDMIRSLRKFPLLDGFRKLPVRDVKSMADALVSLSNFAVGDGARCSEIDVNPLMLKVAGVTAVDALVVMDGQTVAQ